MSEYTKVKYSVENEKGEHTHYQHATFKTEVATKVIEKRILKRCVIVN